MAANTTNTLNRVQYSGLDFNTISDELYTQIQVNYATTYNDFAVSSLGIMLLDIFAFGLSGLAWYLDRRATDLFLSTGRTTKSVARAARQLGYKMSPATASSVDIELTPTTSQIFSIPFPIGYQLTSPDGSYWESGQAYTWPASNTATQTITFSQTQTLQAVFTSDGTVNQVFNISNLPTDTFLVGPGSDNVSQVVVTVNGVTWTENPLLTFGATNQFEIGYQDSPPTLRFGDGTAGNVPATNAQIRLTFKASRGTAGQVTSGQTMLPVTPLSVNFTTINFTFVIPTGSSGGSDPESIASAQANAPLFFAARGVNVTQQDYNVRAGTFVDSVFGGIAAASAILVRDETSDAYLQTLIDDITGISNTYVTTVASGVSTATGQLASATSAVTAATTNSTAITADVTSLNSSVSTATSSANAAVIASGLVTTLAGQITTSSNTLNTTVTGISTGGSNQLTTATQAALLALITSIQAAASQASSQSAVMTSNVTGVTTAISTMQNSLNDITNQQSGLSTNLTSIQTDINSTTTTLSTLVTSVNGINNDISTYAQDILEHVGTFLSSDCQSNLIEVPILTLNSDGFYVAPTIALVQALQTFLDANKEITQVVRVLAADELLINAVIVANIGILPGYSVTVVTSQVQALLTNVLKGRPFGKNLRLSELYWALAPNGVINVPGVSFADIAITGPTDSLDDNGNLAISSNEVVSLGSVTVNYQIAAN